MTRPTLYLNIETEIPASLGKAEKLAQQVLAAVANHTPLPEHPGGTEISLTLVDDATIQQLNAQYRQKDKPTNVLSFPFDDEVPANTAQPLGDVIVSVETLGREATAQKKLFSDHFQHMVTHGILHLLGYDHLTDNEANVMENLEIRILAELNIPNPYDES